MSLTVTHSTASDGTFSASGAAAWDASHSVSGDVDGVVPVGGIIMWSGTIAAIPTSWALCDGTANSPGPDLRDKFIVGATSDSGGVAKTNLTGALTQFGGSISHTHDAHSITQPVVGAHSITQPAISDHSITQPAISDHSITQPAINDHSITQPVVSGHVVTTGNFRTSASATAAAVTAIASHTLSTNVALSAHTLSANVALSSHALSTSVAVSAHSLSTSVALSAHSLTTNVALSAHVATDAPQPYFALAFIQRMT